jgi:hypothetical protein
VWIPPAAAAGFSLILSVFPTRPYFAVNFQVELLVNHTYHNRVNPFRRSENLLPDHDIHLNVLVLF